MIRALCLFLLVTVSVSADDTENTKGIQNADKLVRGQVANLGEFPWQISLRYLTRHRCGGALISKRHVLTASHCTFEKPTNSFTVIAGSYSYYGYNGKIYPVSMIIDHPLFKGNISEHDIAVVVLQIPVPVNRMQYPIALPTKDVPVNAIAVISGWGFENQSGNRRSNDLLKKLPMRIISNAECKRFLPFITPWTQLCAYNNVGAGICQADSGGPLVYNNTVVGVVSGNIPCARGFPDIFTRVYAHNSWIISAMGTSALPKAGYYL